MSGCSMTHPLPPPPPPPPPSSSTTPNSSEMKKLYQTIGNSRSAVEGDHTEPLVLIRQRESSFNRALHWTLVNAYVPSLIQDGPQCGLVALWMAAHLLWPSVDMTAIFQAALSRGFTAQGEMFSARNMASLAEEVCGCKTELLSGGLSGKNTTKIINHLWNRQPVLIPYDEDYNHEPCQRGGHKAHWAVVTGVLLGTDQGELGSDTTPADPKLPWIHLRQDISSPSTCPSADSSPLREIFILAKQGKSLRYQLWNLDDVIHSNGQLRALDPQRRGDGTIYALPQGGVEAGLAGQAVLLHVRTPFDSEAHKMNLNALQ